MAGIKGKRVPGRPGRFDPTEPLHMKTRKATKGSNGTDGSHDEDSPDQAGRRRTSNGTTSTRRSSAHGPEPPTKRQRTNEVSPDTTTKAPSVTGGSPMNVPYVSLAVQNTSYEGNVEDKIDDEGPERNYYHRFGLDGPPVKRSLADIPVSPSQLRMIAARESASNKASAPIDDSVVAKETRNTDSVVEGADAPRLEESFEDRSGPFAVYNSAHRKAAKKDMLHAEGIITSPKPAGSKMHSSASSPSDPHAFGDVNVPALSTDVTPMVTRQGTPATPASGALDETPAGRRTAVLTLGETTDEEGNDLGAIAPTQETVEEVIDHVAEEEEEGEEEAVRKTTKRRYAGGRRRATHANTVVEAAMRRQLELKQIYRQATRAMKSCLGEISQITLDELETKEDSHIQATEYQEVLAELDARLARRKEQLYTAQRFNEEQLKQRWHAERDVRKNTCKNFIEEARAQHIASSEYNILRIHRDRLSATSAPAQDTEDEDGIIPRPKAMSYRFKRADAIDLRYDSRSRFTLETERKINDLAPRIRMWEALKAYAPEAGAGFTVMSTEARDAAEERQASIQMTKKLAGIAEEYAPKPPPPPPPALTAKDLAPLNALAELASRPSLQSKHVPVDHRYPPRLSPVPAMSLPEQAQGVGHLRQSPYQPAASSSEAPQRTRYPVPSPHLRISQPMMLKQETSQGMGYSQQSPRQPARSLPEVSQGMGYLHQSPRQSAHQPPMSMPEVQQGIIYPHQSPRQQNLAPMLGYPGFKRSDSEVASQPPSMPRPMFSEQTMGPPPTPYQATAPALRSPLLHRFDVPLTAASMGGSRGVDGMQPLAAKTSQAPEPQQSQHHSHSPSLPSLPGVHPDRINIIAEANNMTGSTPPTPPPPYTSTNTPGPPPGPPASRTQPTTSMNPPAMYTQPIAGMPQPAPYTPRTQAMQHNTIAPGPQQMYPAPQPHHAQQAQPHQWSHATNQNQGYFNSHVPDRMPNTVRRRSLHEWQDEPTDHPWQQQPRPHNVYPAHFGHTLPPRPPVTEARAPTLPRLPARPPSSGNGMSSVPRNERRDQKPTLHDRHGLSRRKWTKETEEYKDRVRAASFGHHMARIPSPVPEPARRSSALDGLPPPYAGGMRMAPPPVADPLLAPPPPFGATNEGWHGPPPPRPTAPPVDWFGGGVAPRRQLSREEERERREHEELVAQHRPGTFFPRRYD